MVQYKIPTCMNKITVKWIITCIFHLNSVSELNRRNYFTNVFIAQGTDTNRYVSAKRHRDVWEVGGQVM